MAIYHLNAQLISRSQGRSAVASAAYRSAERLYDARLGRTHSFVHKPDVVHTEVLLPQGAPSWAQDRSKLWNAVEAAEKRQDAQVAREVRVALPVELSLKEQVTLVRRFAHEQFTRHGMVADIAIHHDNVNNPHAHIGLTLRPLTEEGFGLKARQWNSRALLGHWRQGWEHVCNRALTRAGHTERIDHRSHAARGLRLEPTCKVGMATADSKDSRQDIIAERVRHNEAVRAKNGAAILRDPTVALEALTAHEATFTRRKVERWLGGQTSGPEQTEACLKAVMSSPDVRAVGTSRWGEPVYSSRQMLACEWELMRLGRKMAKDKSQAVPDHSLSRASSAAELSQEQRAAALAVTLQTGQLAVVEGWAGTGKSRMFTAARQTWEARGLRVVGGAVSGRAAAGLKDSSGINECRTLASWQYAWERGQAPLGPRDVLVIDEASLVGTRQMHRVLKHADAAGAKVVLVGDTRQLQAIEAGSPMRALGQVAGRSMLREVRRQQQPWQRQASVALAAGRVDDALVAYKKDVHQHQGPGAAPAAIARDWVAKERTRQGAEATTQVALTHRRRDVAALNEAIRQARREAGLVAPLKEEVAVQTPRGLRQMAAGDRVCFLRNDRGLGVYNGTTGTVLSARARELSVRLDEGGRTLKVPLNRYNDLDHGYALTVHKAQGVTVGHAHVWATPGMDRHAAYVAMTRHRQGLSVHAYKDDFEARGGLSACLSRARPKGMAMDFAAADKQKQAHKQVVAEARQEAEKRLMGTRESLQAADAAAHSEVIRVRLAAEQPILTSDQAAKKTSAYLEAQRRLQAEERILDRWRYLRQESVAQHGIRARLGLVGQLRVTSPQTGKAVPLDRGMDHASRRHAQAKEALAAVLKCPDIQLRAHRQVQQAKEARNCALSALNGAQQRSQAAQASLKAFDRSHPDIAKIHFCIRYGHLAELRKVRNAAKQARLQGHCERLGHRHQSLRRRVNELCQGPGFTCSWSKDLERLRARMAGVEARIEKSMEKTRRGRQLDRDIGQNLER